MSVKKKVEESNSYVLYICELVAYYILNYIHTIRNYIMCTYGYVHSYVFMCSYACTYIYCCLWDIVIGKFVQSQVLYLENFPVYDTGSYIPANSASLHYVYDNVYIGTQFIVT